MLIKSAILTQGSGSVGGMTLSHNTGGLYLRARTIPTDPSTIYQTAIRNAMSQLTSRWSAILTPAQREAWDVYASNVTITNRLGDPTTISGLSHYTRSNIPRIQAGLDLVDDGPTVFTLAPQEAMNNTASEATQLISTVFLDTQPWCDVDGSAMLIYASRPQQPSINFFKGPYRLAGAIEGDSVAPPTTPQTLAAPFAFVSGHRLFLQARMTYADGRLSAPFRNWVGCAA